MVLPFFWGGGGEVLVKRLFGEVVEAVETTQDPHTPRWTTDEVINHFS